MQMLKCLNLLVLASQPTNQNCHMKVIFLDLLPSRWRLSLVLLTCTSSIIPEQSSECSSLNWQN